MAGSEFGRTLHRWRDRISPETTGLGSGGRRRAPGLRREELALLSGISADYVTRLEQGRAANPSPQIVEALAHALRLTGTERAHLFDLSGLAAPGPEAVPTQIPPSVHRLLDRLRHTPVAVYDAAWTLLLANPPYAALMGDPSSWRGNERNAVWRNLLGSGNRVRHTPQSRSAFEAALVADLRATADRYPTDQQLQRLVAELHQSSSRFATLWNSGAVAHHESSRKTIDHPHVGPLTLDCDVLTVAGNELRIMIYTAEPGSGDAEHLEELIRFGARSAASAAAAVTRAHRQ